MLTTLIRDQLIRKTGDKRKVNYINKAQNPLIRKFFRIYFAYLYFVYFVILLYICLSLSIPFVISRLINWKVTG